jgi:hypothetical protein
MNHFLFAGDRYYPTGGARDLVGIFNEVDDATVFAAVLEKVRQGRIDRDDRIWVNAMSVQPQTLGEARYWEVRMRESLDHPALQFCSIKQDIEGLGPCGIMPLGFEAARHEDSLFASDTLYPLLDPEKRNISWLA